MGNKLDFLLDQTESDFRAQSASNIERIIAADDLKAVHITRHAYDQAFAYAKLVCEISGEAGTEIGGYLVTPKNSNDRVARMAYLATDQIVGSGEIKIQPEDVIRAGREIDALGYRVLGWWHSHGSLDTFHSGIDIENQLTVLNAIAPSNYVIESKERNNVEFRFEGGKLIIIDKANPGVNYEFSLAKEKAMKIIEAKALEEKRIGFCYSLVVHDPTKKNFFNSFTRSDNLWTPAYQNVGRIHTSNYSGLSKYPEVTSTKREENFTIMRGQELGSKEGETRLRIPYAEIATRQLCKSCKETNDVSNITGIELIEEEHQSISEDSLKKEILEKVKIKPRFTIFGGYGKAPKKRKRSRKKGIVEKPLYQVGETTTLSDGTEFPTILNEEPEIRPEPRRNHRPFDGWSEGEW